MRLLAFLAVLLFSSGAYAADPIWFGSSFDTCTLIGFSSPSQGMQPGLGVGGNNCPTNQNIQISGSGSGSIIFPSQVMANSTGISFSAVGNGIFGSSSATPQITVGNSSTAGSAYLELQSALSTQRGIELVAGSTFVWILGNNTASQSGNNAGADFFINRYDDSGNLLDTTLKITRSSGLAAFADSVSIGALLQLSHQTVAGLPTCNTGTKFNVAIVNDANSPSWGQTLSGSGSTITLALCNGSNWVAQ